MKKKIKSCKATNLEFLKLKEKLGLCLYEDICGEKEFILMSEESFIQHNVENKQLKEENKKNKWKWEWEWKWEWGWEWEWKWKIFKK